jgi:uncharacterized protein (TIGR02246 family)
MTDLATAVQEIHDRFAIMDLAARYCHAVDDRDLDTLVSLYTEDGEQGQLDGSRLTRGREAIREYFTQRFNAYGFTFHTPHGHVITFDDGNTAHGMVTGHAEMGLRGEWWNAAVRYHDDYVRENGAWLFRRRMLGFAYYLPQSLFPSAFKSDRRKYMADGLVPAELPESLESWKQWIESHPEATRGLE